MILPAHLPSDPSGQKIDRSSKSVTETTAPGSVEAPPFGIREIVGASPTAARLLPHLMRCLADEIEGAVHIPLPPDPPDAHTDCQQADAEHGGDADGKVIARRVAEELSAVLGRHLAGSATQAIRPTTGGAGWPARSGRPEALSQKPLGKSGITSEYLHRAPTGEPIPASAEEPTALRRLELRLLGTPEVTLDGRRVEAMDRASRLGLILYMLAMHPRGLSAERLAAYIASGSVDLDAFDTDATGATVGLGTVRTFIWRLRKTVGWYGIVVSPGEMGGCSNMYRLPAGTSCDLWDFERNLDQSARAAVRATIDPAAADQAAALRQEAIVLYHGDFCQGVSAGCVAHAAGQLRSRYLQAVLQQATYWKDKASRLGRARQEGRDHGVSANGKRTAGLDSFEEQNAWLQALSNYRLAAQTEPYDEAAYTGAMQCLAHLGDSKGVKETFARCCRVIRAELGRRPLDATMRSAREFLELARAG